MPSPLPRQARWNGFAHYCSIVFGLPQITVGSAPALHFSRPAQRSLALQPADSPSRLMRPSTPEASAALLPPPPLRLLPGGAIQFPGGSFFPLWSSAFHGALLSRCYANNPLKTLPTPRPSLTCPFHPRKICPHDGPDHLALPHHRTVSVRQSRGCCVGRSEE